EARRGSGDGRPPLLRAPVGGGEPADRRLYAQRRRDALRPRARLRILPAPEGTAPLAVRLHLGRRAADDRDRPRADGAPEDDPAARTLDGPSAAAGRGNLRDRNAPARE